MVRVEGNLEMTEQKNKAHRAPRAGKSKEKKKVEDKKRRGLPEKPDKINMKEFASARPGTSQKVRKGLDRSQVRVKAPVADRTFADEHNEAPETVAVVGPPGSGKSSLIRSLVKFYTKQNLTTVKGPVTCVAGKQRRITFIECPNDIHAMCDVARVADLVLLMVDASFGFEMETFEFLNISKSHGFPKLIGVLTHLDRLKDNKQLKKTKKAFRQRFWQEICAGAKLFYMSGVEKGLYPSKEVVNLNRFIAVTKITPQRWRTTHSCILADRIEDLTDPAVVQANPLSDRKVAMYGYVRGCPMKEGQSIHIPGVGDFSISQINRLDDPCALPQRGNKKKTRHLSEKDKKIYAPMADIGGLMYDADAVYIKVDPTLEGAVVEKGEGFNMMRSMLEKPLEQGTIDELMKKEKLSLMKGGAAMELDADGGMHEGEQQEDDEDDEEYDEEDEEDEGPKEVLTRDETGRMRRRAVFKSDADVEGGADEDDDDDDEDDDEEYDGNDVILPADRPSKVRHNVDAADFKGFGEEEEGDDVLFRVQGAAVEHGAEDITRDVRGVIDCDWEIEAVREGIRALFVTGGREEGDGKKEESKADGDNYDKGYVSVSEDEDGGDMEMDDNDDDDDEDEEDEEDEEEEEDMEGRQSGKGVKRERESRSSVADLQSSVKSLIPESLLDPAKRPRLEEEAKEEKTPEEIEKEEYMKKKLEKKRAFDAMYDEDKGGKGAPRDYLDQMKEEMEKKATKTKEAIAEATAGDIDEKVKLVGFYAGLYVRVVLERVPCEFIQNFNPFNPLLLGGLLPSEDRLGVVYMRIKKHRWFPKLLKANDPLVLSVGWRRFQTQPIFALEDPNGRNRYLKYTPLHMHCMAAFYGPITPPNTGVLAFTNAAFRKDVPHFRCAATGYTMEIDHSSRIVKKLKLTGVPAKIYKNTAFIKNMFSSGLEVAKFQGAKIQTVSGIRGTVKKAVTGKGGVFRATFEDKIANSDIIFMRTWKQVDPERFYNPVTNLITTDWVGMKSTTELRRERNIAVPFNVDSTYREVQRKERFNPELLVPKTVAGNLPFALKKTTIDKRSNMSKLEQAIDDATGFALEPEEQARRDLLEQLSLTEKKKKRVERENQRKKLVAYKKHKAKVEAKSSERLKALKKMVSKKVQLRSGGKRGKSKA